MHVRISNSAAGMSLPIRLPACLCRFGCHVPYNSGIPKLTLARRNDGAYLRADVTIPLGYPESAEGNGKMADAGRDEAAKANGGVDTAKARQDNGALEQSEETFITSLTF